jgi:hypothetical protein
MRSSTRRPIIIATGVLAALAVVLVIVWLSSGESETPYADRGSSDDGSAPRGRTVRSFGQTARLKTYLTVIEVRPLAFVKLAASESSGPGVGVDVAIRNVGGAPYRDQPLQAASVTLRRGGEADRVYEGGPECRGLSDDTVRIRPGATQRFCLPFEATGRPDLFVYSAEDGLPGSRGAPEAAAWGFSG